MGKQTRFSISSWLASFIVDLQIENNKPSYNIINDSNFSELKSYGILKLRLRFKKSEIWFLLNSEYMLCEVLYSDQDHIQMK